MTPFADRLSRSIEKTKSHLVAGCDPVLEALPAFIVEESERGADGDGELVERSLGLFCDVFISAVAGRVAAIKPNIAFFEQYGLPGLTVFSRLCRVAREKEIPVIIDAKRGDIGSTAAAYSAAFLGRSMVGRKPFHAFEGDALTVNPYLGFDTLEPFMKDCQEYGKGIFVLVQTSNPGARDLQGLMSDGASVSQHVARWLSANAARLAGEHGWSGVGAVVGASYPEEAIKLRETLPTNFFLIPGFGAQGADAKDSVAGFGRDSRGKRGGALVNVSRGLVQGKATSCDELYALISANADRYNTQLHQALES